MHKSSQYHQGDLPINSRQSGGSQCTAIGAYAVVALLTQEAEVTRKTLDDILLRGDKYYKDSKRQNNVQYNHLAPEDLLTEFRMNQQVVTIGLHHWMDGEFQWSDRVDRLANTLEEYKTFSRSELNKRGFLFVGGNITLSGFVKASSTPSESLEFYLFNSHSVDMHNKTVSGGKVRLLRSTSAKALSELVFTYLNRQRDNFFQVWHLTFTVHP